MRNFLIGLALLVAGCAGGADGVRQGIANTAVVVAAGYNVLNSYDEVKQSGVISRARLGDVDGARAEIADYLPKRNKALKTLDGATATVESAAAALPLLDGVLTKSKDVNDWIAKLLSAALQVKDALAGAGINLETVIQGAK